MSRALISATVAGLANQVVAPALLKPETLAFTALLALMTAMGPLATDMYLPSLPRIMGELSASEAAVQLTLSLFLAGFAVGQILYGPIADRHGRKPVLVFGFATFALASLACAFAPNIETLIAARFFQAVGGSGPIVVARSVIRDVYDGDRAGRELARVGALMGLVPAVAPSLGGVFQLLFGWQSVFLFMVGIGTLGATAVAFALPETIRKKREEPLSPAAMLRGFAEVGGSAAFRAHVVLVCAVFSGLFAFISASSFVLQRIYGLDTLAYGLAFGICALSYVAAALLGGRIVRRIGSARTLGLGCGCAALGGGTMLAGMLIGLDHAAAVVVPMMIYMAGVGLGLPQAMAGALMPFPERAGSASSLMGFTQMVVAAIVGVGVGHALGASPLPLGIALAVAGFASLGLFLATGRARRTGIAAPHRS